MVECRTTSTQKGGIIMSDADANLDPFERDLLYANLKEYLMRTTLLYNLVEQGKLSKDDCYDRLLQTWMEYDEAAQKIFMEEREYQDRKRGLAKRKRPQ
jgi:hypothetical protein